MSLFVGNLSKNVDAREFERKFASFGKPGYAFVEYEDEFNAETAKAELNGTNFGGLRINIEWSKRSGRYNPRESRRYRRSRSRSGERYGRRRGYGRRMRMSPDYEGVESWSYSLSLSPDKYKKKRSKKEESEEKKKKRSRSRDREKEERKSRENDHVDEEDDNDEPEIVEKIVEVEEGGVIIDKDQD